MKLFETGNYWVQKTPKGFTVFDTEGCSKELYHEGDSYPTLEEAKNDAIFFAGGGHWRSRPRNSLYPF
jgi:hypothetical protein